MVMVSVNNSNIGLGLGLTINPLAWFEGWQLLSAFLHQMNWVNSHIDHKHYHGFVFELRL